MFLKGLGADRLIFLILNLVDINFKNYCPEELFKIIQDKQTIEGKLRNMDMVVRSMHEMGYEKDNFEAFKAEYIKSIEGKSWYEFCMGKHQNHLKYFTFRKHNKVK